MLLQYSVSGEFSHSLRVLGITFLSSPDLGVLVCGERKRQHQLPGLYESKGWSYTIYLLPRKKQIKIYSW